MKSSRKLMRKIIAASMAVSFILSCIPAGVFAAPVTEYTNLAAGCDYIISHTPQYGDSGSELTDGQVGAVNFYDSKWVGWSGVPAGTYANVVIDLGSKREFDKVDITALDSTNSGGIPYPEGDLVVSYSDNEDGPFTEFAKGAYPADAPKNSVYTLAIEGAAVEGRYVKVEFNARGWSFLGEIGVFGELTIEPIMPVITTDIPSKLDIDEGTPLNLEVKANVSDAGTITYQWYKDGEAIEGETGKQLFIHPAAIENSGVYYCEVTNNFNTLTKTAKSTECKVVVYPEGFVLNEPVIETNLQTSLNYIFRDRVELKVVATNGNDGGTLSYQWYKDGVAVGTDSDTFVIPSASVADSGNYNVVITNTKEEIYKKSVTSKTCAVNVLPVVGDNLIAGFTYATNAEDATHGAGGDYHNSYYDKNKTRLTDGVKASSWGSGTNVGFHSSVPGNELQLLFEFIEPKNIKEIQMSSFNATKDGLYNARDIRVEALINGNWEIIFTGADRVHGDGKITEVFAVPDDVALTVSAIRFNLADYGAWLFMDEIEVFEDLTGMVPTGNLKISKENNLAKASTYKYSRADDWGYYPDNGNKELIDGMYGDLSYTNGNWVGYSGTFFITFDLGSVEAFSEFRTTFLNNPGPAIEIPETVSVSYSVDNETYTTLSTDVLVAPEGDTLYEYVVTAKEKVSARYVRLEIVKSSGWTFLCETQILRNPLSNPNADENNLAARRDYTSTTATENEDTGLKELTDGKYAVNNFEDEAWTGFAASDENTEIVIDLAAYRTFEQVDVRFLHDPANGIYLPEIMDVFVGDSEDDLRELGSVQIEEITTLDASVSTYKYAFGQEETAKYVKLVFSATDKVYIDEIEVLEKQTSFEQTPDENEADTNNIAVGSAYTTSWESMSAYPDTDNKQLTDGVRGTYLYSHDAWSGFEPKKDNVGNDKEFEIVVDLGDVKDFEQIQIGLLKSTSYTNSVFVPENVKVEISSDGTHWNLYANQGGHIAVDGVNRMNFNLEGEKASAQYIKFTFIVSQKFFIDEICVYKEMMPYGDYELDPDMGAYYNLVLNKPYDLSRSADYRHTSGLLTDGLYMQSGTMYDNNWTGYLRDETRVHFNKVEFMVDMEAANSISEVIIHSKNDAANNMTTPKKVKLYASMDGITWDEFAKIEDVTTEGEVELKWNGETDGFVSKGGEATKVYAKYIKVYFETPKDAGIYAVLDEIQVIGQKGQTSDSDYVASSSGYGNLALGKKYYSVPSSQLTTQPDIGERQLTDGIRGSVTDNTDPAWVVIKQDYQAIPNHAGSKAIVQGYVIDLGKEAYVSQVKVKFISKGFGGTTEYPWTVWTYATDDIGDECPTEWFMLSRQWNVSRAWNGGTDIYGWRSGWKGRNFTDDDPQWTPDTIEGYSTVKTRYIRVDVEVMRTAAIDEIEVFGYETPQEGAYVVAEGSGRDLDNGRDYLKAGERTGGVQDMVLCYNGWYGWDQLGEEYRGDWLPYQYRPYLTYIDKNGKAVDTMFDTVCLLALGDRVGGSFNADVNNKYYKQSAEAWHWYLDKTFDQTKGDVYNLARAADIAAEELGDPNYKVKLVVMHPGADRANGKNFGPLDGKYYDTNFDDAGGSDYYSYPVGDKRRGWQEVSDWWFKEVIERFEDGKAKGLYDRIEFVGFYYLSEQIGYTPAAPKYHIDKAHELGYKMYWIPFNFANGYHWDDDWGWDGVAIQPNHFFQSPYETGSATELGNDYLDTVAFSANYGRVGLEMECDSRFGNDIMKYNQWIDYLNGAYDNGMDGDNCYRNWYEGTKAMAYAAFNEDPTVRSAYDYSYQLMKGTYTPKNYVSSFGEVPTERTGADEIFEGTGTGTGFTGDKLVDNASGNASNGGGGGSYYVEESKPVIGETTTVPETGEAKPSYEGYDWVSENGTYKYADAEGNYATGWVEVNGTWYFFKSNGLMAKGWIKDGNRWYYLKDNGAMATGWFKDAGVWYYLFNWGGMANNEWVYDNGWYYMSGNGAMHTGWLKDGNSWYYLNSNGLMAKGWNWINSDCYFFYDSGRMAANETVNGYKVNANGAWVK